MGYDMPGSTSGTPMPDKPALLLNLPWLLPWQPLLLHHNLFGLPHHRRRFNPNPVYQPAPAPCTCLSARPQYEPPVSYGVFNPYGPLTEEGRVNVTLDHTFDAGQIAGYQVFIQDNGQYGNDQILALGPEGEEHIWVDCNKEQFWRSYGPNSYEFIDTITHRWCGW